MKAIIVNSSTNFEYRVNLIYDYLTGKGYDVTVIASDFIHSSKTKRSSAEYPYNLINTYPYRKNISIQRLYSHYKFSKDAFEEIKDIRADILYLLIPQNSNAELAKKYKSLYPKSRIIMDIVDMWPESLPVKGTELFPFSLWARVRNRNLRYADLIYTECRYYQEKLKKYAKDVPMYYFPWLKKYELKVENDEMNKRETKIKTEDRNKTEDKVIKLFYLGSVNNIIDMDKIEAIIATIRKYALVELHIVGKGERMELFKERAEASGAKLVYYGAVYDEQEKKRIMDSCDFGLNIMKDTVCVGLTMKSIDYMASGLPIINNIPGDTHELIAKYHMGINIDELSGYRLFEAYDRAEIRKIFDNEFEAKNIGKYLEMALKI
ncbi:MAG: glycosyltransferase [Eubacteriales bacterium]|nr:glycosyltransferase [Eubacteriales bacterium]